MRRSMTGLFTGLALAFFAFPDVSAACERCFGAGADAPAVAAVSASMFALLVVMTGVFGGIISFFRGMSRRCKELSEPNHLTETSNQA